MKKLMTVAALALVTACAAQARTESQPANAVAAPEAARVAPETRESSPVTCDIRATRTSHGVRLEAVARTDRALHGTYDFVITARSSSGTSDVTQGGPFDLATGGSATVGVGEISGVRYRVALTLSDADGEELCHLERRS